MHPGIDFSRLPALRAGTCAVLLLLPRAGVCAGPLSFATDIQPIFEQSCLPCHNATRSEGGLILESPKAMIEGGDSGAALKPGHAADSLLFQTASRQKKPFMPPEENKAKAPALTPAQLETLRLWIQEGAQGSPRPKHPVAWKPMPSQVRSVSALASSSNGRFAAAGRGSTVAIYDLLLGRKSAEFAAHPDIVGALAFNPEGTLLATGSRGEIKLWRLSAPTPVPPPKEFQTEKATSPDGSLTAVLTPDTPALLRESATGKELAKLSGNRALLDKVAQVELLLGRASFEVIFLEGDLKTLEERITKLTTDLAGIEKERAALQPKRADMEKTLASSITKKETLEKERDQAEDAVAEAELSVKTADQASTAATAAVNEANAKLKGATPETKPALETALKELQANVTSAAAGVKNANALLKQAKDTRDAKRKEFTDAVKAQGDAAGAVASATILDRNAKNFGAVLEQSKAEKLKQSAALEKAKAALKDAETAHAEAVKANEAAGSTPATGVAFSEDGLLLFTKHADHSVRVWNAKTGVPLPDASTQTRWEPVLTIGDAAKVDSPVTNRVNALAFSPDGKLLASGAGEPSRSGELKVWETHSGKLHREFPKAHRDAVLSLDFSRDGKLLASGSADRAVRVWDMAAGKIFRNLEAHASHVLSVSLRNDARRLISASADNTVKTWDLLKSDVVTTFSTFTKEVSYASYTGKGDEFFAASGAPVLRVFRDIGGEVRSKTDGLPSFITAAAVTADGKTQLIGDASGTVRALGSEGQPLAEWKP